MGSVASQITKTAKNNSKVDERLCKDIQKQLNGLSTRLEEGQQSVEAIASDAAGILSQLEACDACATRNRAMNRLIDATLDVGNELYSQFEQNEDPRYIDLAIRCEAEAVRLTSNGDPARGFRLRNLGVSYETRFKHSDDVQDIDKAIECHTQAVSITPKVHAEMPTRLGSLGDSYNARFEHLGQLDDLEKAVEYLTRAVLLAPERNVHKHIWLNNLGDSHKTRFERIGQPEDIHKAIEYQTRAVSLIPEGHADLPLWLSNLGVSHQGRFGYLGKREDINEAIKHQARAVSLAPEGHAGLPICLNSLGNSYHARFVRFGELDDIDRAIQYQTRAVSLSPEEDTHMPIWLNNLGNSHQSRFERCAQVDDITKAIECHARAVSLTPEGHEDMPNWLSGLGTSYQLRYTDLGELDDINRAIECQTKAVSLTPADSAQLSMWLNNLGNSHQRRFDYLGKLDDIDKAIECQMRAVSLTPEDQVDMPLRLHNLGSSYQLRFERLSKPDDIDRALDYLTRVVSLTPEGDAYMPMRLNNLGCSHHSRFERLGTQEDIHRAIEYKTRAVSLAPKGHADMPMWLSNLGVSHQLRFKHLGGMEDVNSAIECHNRAVSLTPEGQADMPVWLNNLGDSYHTRYMHFGELDDLNKAVECQTRAVSLTPADHAYMLDWINGLGTSYQSRYDLQGDPQSLARAIDCFRQSALSPTGPPRVRFFGASQWAKITSSQEISEHLSAFQQAMSLIPHVVWLGGTVTQRYSDVQDIGDLAIRASAAAISAEKYELALEWLEQGRSIVWNQAVQLRTPFDNLFAVNPSLADELRQVADQLNSAGAQPQNRTISSRDVASLEQAAQKHHRIAERYDELVKEARKIPGFKDFLQPKKASELLPAARTGPVVIVNAHRSRCDALVLLPGEATIKCIPLLNLSYDQIANARAQLEQSLEYHGLRERNSSRGLVLRQANDRKTDNFGSVLGTLWSTVGKPMIDFFGYTKQSNPTDLPHVTWCLTGPLSFLPLHASCCYDEPQARLSDFVVSSYTPTLSALLPTGSGAFTSSNHSRVLAIGLETTANQSPLPGTKAELFWIQQHAQAPLQCTQINNDNATTAEVLAGMEGNDWVHLACHATQDVQDPTESGFFLHDGMLSLATIMQKSFRNKGLAFLSACQTAKGDMKLPEEAVHLASAMILAGYPSVIATMWSVNDGDAPVIADKVYARLLEGGKMDHRDASMALHIAVNHLREEVGEKQFARWVPYIHIGV